MCVSINQDVVPPGQRCLAASNRNFENRQGPGSRTHLASPIMAAAAVTGAAHFQPPRVASRASPPPRTAIMPEPYRLAPAATKLDVRGFNLTQAELERSHDQRQSDHTMSQLDEIFSTGKILASGHDRMLQHSRAARRTVSRSGLANVSRQNVRFGTAAGDAICYTSSS